MSARKLVKIIAGIGVGAAATGATMIGLKGPITSAACARIPNVDSDHCIKAVAVEMNSASMCESITGARFGVSIDGGPTTVIENPPKMECLSQVAARTNDPSICNRVEGLLIAKTKIDCLYDVASANSNAAACDAIGAEEQSRMGTKMNAYGCRALINRPKGLDAQNPDQDSYIRVVPREASLPQCENARTDYQMEVTEIAKDADPQKAVAMPDGAGGVTFFPKMTVEVGDGDTIIIPSGFTVTITGIPGYTFMLEPDTTFKIPCKSTNEADWEAFHEKGIMRTNTEYLERFDPVSVSTKEAIAGVKGTQFVTVAAAAYSRFYVLEGTVEVRPKSSSFQPVSVQAGQMTTVSAYGVDAPKAFTPSEIPKGPRESAPATGTPASVKPAFAFRLGHIPYALAYGGAGLTALSLVMLVATRKKKSGTAAK